MIPVVAFDLGKVLVDFDYSIAGRRIAAHGNKSALDVQAFLDHSPLLFRYETGLMSRKEFFDEVRQYCDFRAGIEEFSEFFADIFTPIDPMIQLQAELRRRGVSTYIFSNTNDLAVEHVRRSFPFFSHFDGYILSYEVGAMKPNVKIYEALEALANRRGSEVIYIDDRAENVAGGVARGWQSFLHESPEKTRATIERINFAMK